MVDFLDERQTVSAALMPRDSVSTTRKGLFRHFFDDIFEFSSKFYPKPVNLVGIHNDFAKSMIDYSGSTTRKDLL